MGENNIISIRLADMGIVKLECESQVQSVEAIARARVLAGCPDRYAVVAEYDGQHGNERGVYLSLILRPSLFPSQASFLSALATVALVTALDTYTDSHLGIGWVSNVYCNGRLIGGVNVEGKLDNHTTYEYIIVNFAVKLSNKDFPPRLSDLVKKVFESDNNTLATIIAKTVLTKFFTLYSSMKQPEKMMDVYFKRSILSGVRAKYVKDGKRVACRILTVKKEDCRLQIELKREKTIIDVSSPANVIIPKSIRLPKPKKARAQDEEQEEDESNEDKPDTQTDKNNDG